jgi:hypothetical protein
MAYAFVAYQTAYLKANYPAEFMAALLTSESGNLDKVAIYVDDEPDEKGRYGAALLFVRWGPSGDRPVGHVETPILTRGATPGEATDRLEAWSLFDVKAALDEAIAAAPEPW